jgi:hypothetical protein
MRSNNGKSRSTVEYGDFQTPYQLARQACETVSRIMSHPATVLEPTCGGGAFLHAAADVFSSVSALIGRDINKRYLDEAASRLGDRTGVELEQSDFFSTDWSALLDSRPGPVLVVGNPPWVTNAELSAMDSKNLPRKSNLLAYKGLDAKTGKSNFDISEWMVLELMRSLQRRDALLAMLVKSAVARRVLLHAWKAGLAWASSCIYSIDANRHFGVSVSACLLVVRMGAPQRALDCGQFEDLDSTQPQSIMGIRDGGIIADTHAYDRWKHLMGTSSLQWRSGIKHDCAKVMEFKDDGGVLRNGFGACVRLEEDYLYPLLKSSDVGKSQCQSNRRILVTQRSTGEETISIQANAPRTWAYLVGHRALLEKRKSSIYRGRPPFSIFGIGEYSFARWKVAISGLYKRMRFSVAGPRRGKPTMLDDTCYFLPCHSERTANLIAKMLNSEIADQFFRAFIFWDAKRPITVELLKKLDLEKLARELGYAEAWKDCRKELDASHRDPAQGYLFAAP